MTRAEELRKKAAQHAARQKAAAAPAGDVESPRTTVPTPLARPIRSTIDLPPARHRALNEWMNEQAVVLGRGRLTKQEVIAALVGRLLTDETLSRLITADLRDSQ